METKNKIIKENQLLESRQESLENVVGSLRSHGKLWGMDVFSWYKPDIQDLVSTLSSFPAPICWFSNSDLIKNTFDCEYDWVSNINLLCSFDRAGFIVENEILDAVDDVLGSANLVDALKLLKSLKKQKGILLFTSASENWKEDKNVFEGFLDFHQIKSSY